jgi:hypothetical protein
MKSEMRPLTGELLSSRKGEMVARTRSSATASPGETALVVVVVWSCLAACFILTMNEAGKKLVLIAK